MMALRYAIVSGILLATLVPASAADRREARSPDGRLRAWVKPVEGPAGASGEPATALWLTDTVTGVSRQVFRGSGSADPKRNRASLANPDFSLDGGYVYVEADAYVTSPAIHQIDVRTGTARYVTDGGLYGVLRNGSWRGYLVVQQHRYRRDGAGSYDPYVVVRPDGSQVAVVPGTTGLDPDRPLATWLRAKGWTAS
ncbi:hypothetical protein ASG11_05340 [Sphingomonas sp. Leaf357]|uniref:hypothetical protein n=1 Tax=Sphingomonas sp. Leaf357 TaxID=1736350 RepID=UPI0006FCAE33|nr:hypothetical protein [Sphingomonas sp. Leaf357]KQS03738.1 hypothetical protein ASG11_05340 [Sphingomonas sp. Leaf357]